ncbi:uncharacterized protein LOC134822321 [Bolinopsis microptera]|uniref:uncharacterized protein LOC134822321 n=1 Tax=Bolinopsis microptera TaxID=2820187 RepID=UPI00307A50C1
MPAMVRVLFALFLEVCLVTLSVQRPASANVNYEIVCEIQSDGTCNLVIEPRQGKDPQNEIEVVADSSVVRVAQGQDVALICFINTEHDLATIDRVFWYKYKNTGEWVRQNRRTAFNGDEMSINITVRRDAKYRCKACYEDSCTSADINVQTGGRRRRST